jgi:hypothetical protein
MIKMMRKLGYILSGLVLSSLGASFVNGQDPDSIEMGSGYANDIYYSMSTGEVKSEPLDNWHIAFSTGIFSSTILINDGAGVLLYTYPEGDIGAWDTISIDSIGNWTPQYNSPDTTMIGAFDRNTLGHPDYGWGVYNELSHDVIGDSLYVIQLPDQSYKKLWIEKKMSMQNKYVLRHANLDGSMDTTVTVEINPFVSKNFAYFSLETNETIDREPSESWDILFTRYYDERIPYPVTGVVSNIGVQVGRITGADTASTCYSNYELSERRTVIGSDWKTFNMETYQYDVEDSLVFVVQDTSGMEYSLYFTAFDYTIGKAVFIIRPVDCPTGTSTVKVLKSLQTYPNPADNELFIRHDLTGAGTLSIHVYDMTGKRVIESYVETKNAPQVHLDVSGLRTGLYILQLRNHNEYAVTRFTVR